jgi:hypothetical protein
MTKREFIAARRGHQDQYAEMLDECWEAACAWQREQDAELAETYYPDGSGAADRIAEVIRAQGSKQECAHLRLTKAVNEPAQCDDCGAEVANQDNPDRCPEALDGEHYFTRPVGTREFFCERCEAHATQEQHDKLVTMLAKQAHQEGEAK